MTDSRCYKCGRISEMLINDLRKDNFSMLPFIEFRKKFQKCWSMVECRIIVGMFAKRYEY